MTLTERDVLRMFPSVTVMDLSELYSGTSRSLMVFDSDEKIWIVERSSTGFYTVKEIDE